MDSVKGRNGPIGNLKRPLSEQPFSKSPPVVRKNSLTPTIPRKNSIVQQRIKLFGDMGQIIKSEDRRPPIDHVTKSASNSPQLPRRTQ